jgi:HAD superfamily hydrolase (TIGR01509 family)
MKLKAIFFDFFGTLAFLSKKPNLVRLFSLVIKLGFDLDYKNFNKASQAAFKYLFFQAKSWDEGAKLIFERLSKKPTKETTQRVANYFKENLAFKFYKDVNSIKRLPVKKAILTTAPRFLLSDLPLDGFDKIFTPTETKTLKPDLRAFSFALKTLKVLPGQALMVGDDLEKDIFPAKKLGMKTVLIDRDNKIKVKDPSIRKISSLEELKKIVF